MIRKLEVKGLNNQVDGDWEFNEDLNIITGRNGSGKTTLLKLIWYLVSGNLGQAISEIAFRSVLIKADAFSLDLARVEPDIGKYKFEIADQGFWQGEFTIPLQLDDFQQLSKAHRLFTRLLNRSLFFPSFRRIEGGFDYLSKHTTIDNLAWICLDDPWWRSADEGMGMLQKAMSQLSTEISVYGEHQLIAAISTHDIVDLLNQKYANVSTKTNALYEQFSQEISQTISATKEPNNAPKDTSPVLEGIQKRVEQVTKERESLLRPLSVLSERIGDILQYKGIRVNEEITLGDENGAMDADRLSAGEKQMLSFLCYNTFNENTAIFIDEPELSLHVDWQRRLLPTLLEQGTGNQFFFATHSPFIYAKYPDKEIQLSEDRGGD